MKSFRKVEIIAPIPDYELRYRKKKRAITSIIIIFITLLILSIICFVYFQSKNKNKNEEEQSSIKNNEEIKVENPKPKVEMTPEEKKTKRTTYEDPIQSIIETGPSPNITAAICMIVKNEKDYLQEFVDYYKLMNFTKIIIYDNNFNGKDDENIRKPLEDYIKSGLVEIHDDFKGRTDYPNFKKEAYEKCYKDNINKYDWFFNINSDEYLFIMNRTSIQRFLVEKRYTNCSTIRINSKTFTDNGKLYYNSKFSLQQRYRELIPEEIPEYNDSIVKDAKPFNSYVRTLVRGGLKDIVVGEYAPEGVDKQCKASGEFDLKGGNTSTPIDYSYAFIKNYYFKSTDEYVKKIQKNIQDKDLIKKEVIQRYFYMNSISLDKIKIIEKGFNITLPEIRAKLNDKKKN